MTLLGVVLQCARGSVAGAAERLGEAIGGSYHGRRVHAPGLTGETFERTRYRHRRDNLARR